ncbi:MAG: DoxX family protein [Bdellovibrionales bacterium]|nr:DoxX family protein [Bdellovibrionales bacterium]
MKESICKLISLWNSVLDSAQGWFLLIIRIYFGYRFMLTGWGKFQNFENTLGFFQSLSIPFPELNVWIVASTEFFGGICLILGLFPRIITVPLVFSMVVAYLTAHSDSLGDATKMFKQEPFPFLVASLLVLIFGPGKFALDSFCKSRCNSNKSS